MPRIKHECADYYLKAAEKHGLTVKPGRGDHYKIYAPDGQMMVVPRHKQLASGTECAIMKWLLAVGVILPALVCAVTRLVMGGCQ